MSVFWGEKVENMTPAVSFPTELLHSAVKDTAEFSASGNFKHQLRIYITFFL